MTKVDLSKELRKKVKAYPRIGFPVHLYWAWEGKEINVDLSVHPLPERQTYMFAFPGDVAIMGGGISLVVAKDRGFTYIFINKGESVVVVESQGRIYGLRDGLVYVIESFDDIDMFFEEDFDYFELYSPFREVEEV